MLWFQVIETSSPSASATPFSLRQRSHTHFDFREDTDIGAGSGQKGPAAGTEPRGAVSASNIEPRVGFDPNEARPKIGTAGASTGTTTTPTPGSVGTSTGSAPQTVAAGASSADTGSVTANRAPSALRAAIKSRLERGNNPFDQWLLFSGTGHSASECLSLQVFIPFAETERDRHVVSHVCFYGGVVLCAVPCTIQEA